MEPLTLRHPEPTIRLRSFQLEAGCPTLGSDWKQIEQRKGVLDTLGYRAAAWSFRWKAMVDWGAPEGEAQAMC